MTQADLFSDPVEEGEHLAQTEVRFPPNPLDGLVHLLADVDTRTRPGSRIVSVKCGARMPVFRSQDRLVGAFGWASVVTCPNCNPTTKEPHNAPVTA